MSYKHDFKLPKLDNVKTPKQARDVAIDWQNWQSEQAPSYGEVVFYQNYFEQLAEKFDLSEEFAENGII